MTRTETRDYLATQAGRITDENHYSFEIPGTMTREQARTALIKYHLARGYVPKNTQGRGTIKLSNGDGGIIVRFTETDKDLSVTITKE